MTESAPPKLFDHCCRVFGAMRRKAAAVQLSDGGDQTRHALVYEGHTTKLFRDLELPTPYYTSVMRRLREMGCILQLSRGGGGSPSRWELLQDPEIDNFMSADKKRREAPTRIGQAEAQIRTLDQRVKNLEDQWSKMTLPEAVNE